MGYADDVVLVAPSASAMRRMISICEAFAKDFRVTFNCDKIKCITYSAPVLSKELRPVFLMDGKCIEIVDKWSHLGHLSNINCNDNDDIQTRIGQVLLDK